MCIWVGNTVHGREEKMMRAVQSMHFQCKKKTGSENTVTTDQPVLRNTLRVTYNLIVIWRSWSVWLFWAWQCLLNNLPDIAFLGLSNPISGLSYFLYHQPCLSLDFEQVLILSTPISAPASFSHSRVLFDISVFFETTVTQSATPTPSHPCFESENLETVCTVVFEHLVSFGHIDRVPIQRPLGKKRIANIGLLSLFPSGQSCWLLCTYSLFLDILKTVSVLII